LEVKPVVEKPLVEVKPPPSPELVNIVDEVGRVVGEVERYEGYLNELERRRGELSGDVYVRLKSMYEGEVAQRKSRIEDLTNKAVKMGAWKCLRCGMVNLPSINICRKCGWKQQ
jgi:ribosomal protein L40E